MEKWAPIVMESSQQLLPAAEKAAVQAATVDMQWIVDRTSSVWTGGICGFRESILDTGNREHVPSRIKVTKG